MKARWILLLAATAATAVSAQPSIYRCEEGGRVEYGDRPCGTRAVSIDTIHLAAIDHASSTGMQPEDAVGLDFRDVLARHGKPSETQVHWRGRVMTETWVWRRSGPPFALTFHAGRVVAR